MDRTRDGNPITLLPRRQIMTDIASGLSAADGGHVIYRELYDRKNS